MSAACARCNDSGVVASPDGEALDCPNCDGPESSAATRRYMAKDLMVRSHLMWLRGYLESSDPQIVPKLDMAIQREQELRDRYYDALDDLRAIQEAS